MGFEVAEKVSVRGKIQKHLKSFSMKTKTKNLVLVFFFFFKLSSKVKISSQISVRKKG